MRAFLCESCKQPVPDPRDQYAERLEYRRLDGRRKFFVRTLRHLCLACVRGEVQQQELQRQTAATGARQSSFAELDDRAIRDWRAALKH